MSQSSIQANVSDVSNLPTSNGNGTSYSNGTSHQNHLSIPFNKKSKIYSLNESVEIYRQIKPQLLSTDLSQFNNDPSETFKNDRLVPPLNSSTTTDLSLEKLSVNNSIGESEPQIISSDMHPHIEPEVVQSEPQVQPQVQPKDQPQVQSQIQSQVHSQIHHSDPQPVQPIIPEPVQSHPQNDLIAPTDIQWYYLDSSNKEQGPFNGDLMQSWYTAGYLNGELQIKRQNGEYQTLHDFCISVNTTTHPFTIPLPSIQRQLPLNGLNGGVNGLNSGVGLNGNGLNGINNGVNNDTYNFLSNPMLNHQYLQSMQSNLNFNQSYPFGQMNSMNQSISMNPQSMNPLTSSLLHQQISANTNGWNLNSNPSTPSSTQPQLSQISNINPAISNQLPQPTPRSPWSHSHSRVNSPFLSAQLGSQPSDPIDTHPIVQPNVIQVEEVTSSQPIEPIVQPTVIKNEIPVVPEPEPEQQPIVQPKVVKNEPKSEPKSEPKKVFRIESIETKVEPETSKSTNKAPWANLSEKSTPKMGLREIQKLDNEKAQKTKVDKTDVQAKLIEEAKLIEKQEQLEKEKSKPSVPMTWGSVTQAVKPAKTLAEIQEEERKASELGKSKLKSTTSQTSLASTLQSSVSSGNAWTTVTSTKKPIKTNSSTSIPTISQSSKLSNPQTLRNISASIPIVDNSNKLREEFVIWARSQMTNLYPNVSPNDLLEMFISLPNNSDSSMLISETIYGSSTTMNGRVFAQDFLKKRQQVEKQVANDLDAWKTVIVESADKVAAFDEDGWSTTKTKKKGRKN